MDLLTEHCSPGLPCLCKICLERGTCFHVYAKLVTWVEYRFSFVVSFVAERSLTEPLFSPHLSTRGATDRTNSPRAAYHETLDRTGFIVRLLQRWTYSVTTSYAVVWRQYWIIVDRCLMPVAMNKFTTASDEFRRRQNRRLTLRNQLPCDVQFYNHFIPTVCCRRSSTAISTLRYTPCSLLFSKHTIPAMVVRVLSPVSKLTIGIMTSANKAAITRHSKRLRLYGCSKPGLRRLLELYLSVRAADCSFFYRGSVIDATRVHKARFQYSDFLETNSS